MDDKNDGPVYVWLPGKLRRLRESVALGLCFMRGGNLGVAAKLREWGYIP